jgi:signal transduction histidine kinase
MWLLANHELRQPIGSLSLLAEALKSDCSPSRRRAIAIRIQIVAHSLEKMLNQLYRLTSPVDDKAADGPVFLPQVIVAAIDELRPAAAAADILIQPVGIERLEAAIRLPLPAIHLAELLKAMLLYPIKLGTGQTVEISAHRRGHHVYVDVRFEGPDPSDAMRRLAFIELAERDGRPDQLIQGLGLAMAATAARQLDLVLSSRTLVGGRQRLTLRCPFPA